MHSAGIGQFGTFDFVFLDIKQNEEKLNKSFQKELRKIEKLTKRVLTSRKKVDTELQQIFPQLFSLRFAAIELLADQEIELNSALDEIYPSIEELGENPKLKKIGFHLSQALSQQRKLIRFFTENGAITKDSIEETSQGGNLSYESFLMALQLMPPQISRLISGLTKSSLQIEFVSMAAIMIQSEEISCSDAKIIQLTNLAAKTAMDYTAFVNVLFAMISNEMFFDEKTEWSNSFGNSLSRAYSDDEPDYSRVIFKEPNPDYQA